MLNCYYAHSERDDGPQVRRDRPYPSFLQEGCMVPESRDLLSSRLIPLRVLQRRCYWQLESEDDIVLVHYLTVDKARNAGEPTAAVAAEAARLGAPMAAHSPASQVSRRQNTAATTLPANLLPNLELE